MMVRKVRAVIRAAALVGVAGAAMAQSAAPIKQSPDQWRASKLVGMAIYGPGVTSVGKISDILIGQDGKVQAVVVGIGGILGIGEKDVALPFDQVTFSNQPIAPEPAAPSAQNAMASASTAGGTPSAASRALAGADTPMAPAATDVLGAPSQSAASPDHGTIKMTAEQLRNAPGFQYAN